MVGQLRELTVRYPLRERYWEQLMVALCRAGRQAGALDTYRRLYRMLADELGVEPGAAVRELHRSILAGDPPPPEPATPSGCGCGCRCPTASWPSRPDRAGEIRARLGVA